jgi:protein involved in polysaccharide export with SLBB domain
MKIFRSVLYLLVFALSIFLVSCASDENHKKGVQEANRKAKIEAVKLRKEEKKKILAELRKDNEEAEKNIKDMPKGPYRLKIGDELEISVLDEPEMTKNVTILPDGRLTYLLVGEVPAEGKTIEELRKVLEKQLIEYFKDPKVSVIAQKVHLEEMEPGFASAMGALKSPGKFEIYKGETITGIVARAGGFLFVTDNLGGRTLANLKASYISRNGKKLPIDFYGLFEEGKMEYDIKIEPGDFVYIANAQTEQIYVLGEVNTPRLVSYNRNITLVEAISGSGGFTEKAQRSRVIVIRGEGGEESHINVDVEALLLGDLKEQNIALKSGDIVYVPEQGLSEYSRYAGYLMNFADLVLRAYQVREAVLFPPLSRTEVYGN